MGRAHEVRAASMAKTAAAKSKLNAKYGRAIFVAAKSGVPDPDLNQTLKKEIEKARKEQVSADVIKRAIEKAKGNSTESYDPVRYEGFGPNNSMFIVECLTDNTNRTYTAIRTAFSKCGFNLGVTGSVVHMFNYQAVFSFEGKNDEETLELLLNNDCDVTDIAYEDGLTTIYAPTSEYSKIKEALTKEMPDVQLIEDTVSWIPQNYTHFSEERDLTHLQRLLDTLDELDDVQEVYHNVIKD